MPKPTGLNGPYPLTRDGVTKAVTATSPGAYALGYLDINGVFIIAYVGRSDDDVGNRLLDHVPKPHPQFLFVYLGSAQAAFLKECQLYHDFSPPENVVHPARPRNTNWKCPRCNVFG